MVRGTTPTLKFILPFDADSITNGYVTISQRGIVRLSVPISRCVRDEKTLSITLTQKETLMLYAATAEIQLRLKIGERAIASNIIIADVGKILREGEI